MNKRFFPLFLFHLFACICIGKNIIFSPLSYGLQDATDDTERYRILLRCHQDAVKIGAIINYKGIDTIKINIPDDAVPIPIAKQTDFSGVTLIVNNSTKRMPLFKLYNSIEKIDVDGLSIDNGRFENNKTLRKGSYLLVIEDDSLWTPRTGYSTNVRRRDAFIVKDGKSLNSTVFSYSTSSSRPQTWYRKIVNQKTQISNLNFVRTSESQFETFCIWIDNSNNIELNNICINTPDDSLKYGDAAIQLQNCVSVTLNSITINGTYSQTNNYGYGVCLNNINNLTVNRMYGRAKWGVFGTYCLNKVTLSDCDINRFDIHCYGRDVKAINCKFSDCYNQFSSVYGKFSFIRCEFENFTPLLIESSFNAFTPFDVIWKYCTFRLNEKRNYIINLLGVPELNNNRPELRRKCLPNITIKNCSIILSDSISNWYLIKTGNIKFKGTFDYISRIKISNVDIVNGDNKKFEISTTPLKYSNKVNISVKMNNK